MSSDRIVWSVRAAATGTGSELGVISISVSFSNKLTRRFLSVRFSSDCKIPLIMAILRYLFSIEVCFSSSSVSSSLCSLEIMIFFKLGTR